MLTLNLTPNYHRFPTWRPARKMRKIGTARRALSLAIALLFFGAIVFVGMWVIAMQTGFVGAIGVARAGSE